MVHEQLVEKPVHCIECAHLHIMYTHMYRMSREGYQTLCPWAHTHSAVAAAANIQESNEKIKKVENVWEKKNIANLLLRPVSLMNLAMSSFGPFDRAQ